MQSKKLPSTIRKHILKLASCSALRRETNSMLIYGQTINREYNGPRIITITKQQDSTTSFYADDSFFKRVTREPAPQGIISVIPIPKNLTEQINHQAKRTLVLFELADPSNVGSLIRTAVALGWDQVVLAGRTSVDPTHPTITRTSLGASLKIRTLTQTEDLSTLFRHNQHVFLAEPAVSKTDLLDSIRTSSDPICLVLGSEAHGLTCFPSSLRQTSRTISIPTDSRMVPCLNVAAAGAILMYHLRMPEPDA